MIYMILPSTYQVQGSVRLTLACTEPGIFLCIKCVKNKSLFVTKDVSCECLTSRFVRPFSVCYSEISILALYLSLWCQRHPCWHLLPCFFLFSPSSRSTVPAALDGALFFLVTASRARRNAFSHSLYVSLPVSFSSSPGCQSKEGWRRCLFLGFR